jgi:Polysaccharide lyase
MPPSGLLGLVLLAGALAGCLLLSAERASAKQGSLAITSPEKSAKVGARIKLTVRASRAYRRVRFRLDGRRLWVDRKFPFTFRRSSYLDTSRLKRGKHRILVGGRRRNGALNRVSRVFSIQHRRKTPRHRSTPPPPFASVCTDGSDNDGDGLTDFRADPGCSSGTDNDETNAPPPPPLPASGTCGGTPVVRGTFNDSIAPPFIRTHAEAADRITRVTSPVAEGSHAGRFEVRPGDVAAEGNRAEVVVTFHNSASNPCFAEGAEGWVCSWVYIPDGTATTSGWRIIQQQTGNGLGSPPVATFLDTNPLRFRIGHGSSSTTDWTSAPIERNRWYRLATRLRASSNPSVGFVEVYLNGQIQTLTNGQTRRYRVTREHNRAHTFVGLYRSNSVSQTDVVYHDDIVIGRPW